MIIGYAFYIVIKRQINRLTKKEKLNDTTARNLTRVIKYLIILIILSAIFFQFAESLGLVTALFSLAGGTIIGFATMNTLGNAIAGLIIMISRPFTVGDRILYNNEIVDIIDIKLIFTLLVDLNGIKISVPNQKLLTNDIIDLGKDNTIRRVITVTPSFDEDRNKVETVLLKAANTIPEVLNDPEPYVWIKTFQNYAVEYNLFVFINDLKNLPLIESNLHKAVLDHCKENQIDIRTPMLIQKIDNDVSK
jgi:potassium efflux system protein